jgi:hypothetical protein
VVKKLDLRSPKRLVQFKFLLIQGTRTILIKKSWNAQSVLSYLFSVEVLDKSTPPSAPANKEAKARVDQPSISKPRLPVQSEPPSSPVSVWQTSGSLVVSTSLPPNQVQQTSPSSSIRAPIQPSVCLVNLRLAGRINLTATKQSSSSRKHQKTKQRKKEKKKRKEKKERE